MRALQVFFLGGIRIVCEGQPSPVKVTHTVQALLAYLLLHRYRTQSREVLAGTLWGDHSEERARSCLSTALWRLRCALEPEGTPRGTYLATPSTDEVGFNCASDYWLDVAAFEVPAGRVLARPVQAMEAADALDLENAVLLYTGDLLEGFYDDWTLSERERLRGLYLNSLAHLMCYYRYHEAHEKSLACGRQILHHEPLREEVHREMMRLYLENGQRALAVRQYETCRQVLAAELSIEPMEETQALCARIASGVGPKVESTADEAPTCLQQALQELRLAVRGYEEGREKLQRAVRLVEHLGECLNP